MVTVKTDCDHSTKLRINAKCADMCNTTFPNGVTQQGYAPAIPGIGGGDYVDLSICMNCHRVVGFQTKVVKALMTLAEAQTQDLEDIAE